MKTLRLFFLSLVLVSCSCTDSTTANPTPPVVVPPVDPPVVIPPLSEAELLNQVQKDALKYFVEYAQTNSKLARERYHVEDTGNDANIVTIGGSGFGLMTILVGIERNFIDTV